MAKRTQVILKNNLNNTRNRDYLMRDTSDFVLEAARHNIIYLVNSGLGDPNDSKRIEFSFEGHSYEYYIHQNDVCIKTDIKTIPPKMFDVKNLVI